MSLPFLNSVAQSMPGYGSGSNNGSATQALTATGTITIAATTTTPSTGGTAFNLNGGPAPSRGKARIRTSAVNAATTTAVLVTVTDGTTTLQVGQIPTTVAGTAIDETFSFNTDLSITGVSFAVTLAGTTQAATTDCEVSLT